MNAKVFASFSPDPDRPMVMIYGNPAGLKELASRLIEYAEYQQNKTGHDPSEHWHLFPGHHGLISSSFEVTISRMDDRANGETDWCETLLDNSQVSLRQQLDRLRNTADETTGQSDSEE